MIVSQSIQVHFGNPDFDYQDALSTPRLTLGAFRLCLDALFEAATGACLLIEWIPTSRRLIIGCDCGGNRHEAKVHPSWQALRVRLPRAPPLTVDVPFS